MSEELKLCPFCGGEAQLIIRADGFKLVHCPNEHKYEEDEYPLDDWQTRPIEDTLHRKLEVANYKITLFTLYLEGEKLAGISSATETLNMIDAEIERVEKGHQ